MKHKKTDPNAAAPNPAVPSEQSELDKLLEAEHERAYRKKIRVFDRKMFRINAAATLAAFAAALAVYAFHLAPGVLPGVPADSLCSILGLQGGVPTRHLAWNRLVAWAVSSAPAGSATLAANALGWVFSSLAVALAYFFCSQLLLLCMDYEFYENRLKRNPTHRLGSTAVAGGLAAAGTLLFCAPCWTLAAQARPDSFYLAWLLFSASLLLRFGATGRTRWLAAFAVVHGAGLSQTACFWGTLVPFAVYGLYVLWANEKIDRLHGLVPVALLLGAFAGMLWADFGKVAANEFYKGSPTAAKFVFNQIQAGLSGITGSIPQAYWMILIGMAVAPFLALLVVAPRALNGDRDVAMLAMHGVIAIVSVLVVLDPPFSPWQLYNGESPQLLPHAFVALSVGYLVAWADLWIALRGGVKSLSGARVGLAAGASLLILFSALHNAGAASPRRTRFVGRYLDAILDGLQGRTWVVTGAGGLFDSALRVRASERGLDVKTIDLSGSNKPRALADVTRLAPTVRLRNVARVGFVPMLKEWIARGPEAGAEIALCCYPDLWCIGDWDVLPSGLTFLGVPKGEAVPEAAAIPPERFAELAGLFKDELDEVDEDDFPWRRRLAFFVRQHVSFAGNNLAFLLEGAGRTEEAYALYKAVNEFNPEHVPALLNRATLVRQGVHPEDEDEMRSALEELQKAVKAQRHPELANLALLSGYVSDPAAYAVAGWNWARSGEPRLAVVALRNAAERLGPDRQNAILAVLAEMQLAGGDAAGSEETWRSVLEDDPGDNRALAGLFGVCLLDGRLEEARGWLEQCRIAGVPQGRLLQLEAALALAFDDVPAAREAATRLRALLPDAPEGAMLLSQIEVASFHHATSEDEREAALERLKTEVEALVRMLGPDKLPSLLASGECKRLENRFAAARQDYLAAIGMMEAGDRMLQHALSNVLELDFRLADKPAAREHAREMLALAPDHAFANYILGSLALDAEDWESAEDYLQHAREATETFFVLNDLAVAQQQLGKIDAAEETARLAVAAGPDEYAPHDTLGYILFAKGDTEGAMAEFERAQVLFGTDPRIDLHVAMAAFALGQTDRARRIYAALREDAIEFSGQDELDRRKLERSLEGAP